MSRHDAGIVGGGLAGLVAARDLRAAGVDAVLLEARDRVGGRTWSSDVLGTGARLDLGAEWVCPDVHTALTGELARYGLDLIVADLGEGVEAHPQPSSTEFTAEFARVLRQCDADASRINFDDSSWYHAVEHLDFPMLRYATGLTDDVRVREYFLANAFALMGSDEREYSTINLLHEFAGFGSAEAAFTGETARIGGGADALALAIAAGLNGYVHRGCPVFAVRTSEDGGVISGPSGSVEARAVVVAAPINVLTQIDFQPPLPAPAGKVVAAGHAGRAAKGWALPKDPGTNVHSMGWPDAVEVYTVQGDRGAAVAAFGVAAPSHDQALARAWAAVADRHPGTEWTGDFLSHDWIADPYAGGTWATPRPGQAEGLRALADLDGPCFVAGGDVSRRWFGWMDGAITSGADVARRVIDYLDGNPVPPARG